MKRVLLFALAAALLFPTVVGCGVGEWFAERSLFENEDRMREDALSAATARTEGVSSRFFLQDAAAAEDRYIVRFAEHMSEEEILQALADKPYTLLSASGERVFAVELRDAQAFADGLGDALVYCCPDRVLTAASVPNDPMAGMWEDYEVLELFSAWETATASADVTVAVLDTGIDRSHKDFAGANILDGYDAVSQSVGVSEDADGHGTAVAGLIAAVADNGVGTAGVAHGVTVLPIRVSGDANRIYSSDLIGGIRFAADADADIINLSFGGYTYSAAEYDAVSYAIEKGCILIAAAGNDGETEQAGKPIYPAAYDGVISVGSCGENGTRSLFSQNNDSVDVLAPGEELFLLACGDSYCRDSGTSYSAAIVSGVAALALSALNADVRLEGDELLSLLADGGRRKTGSGYGAVSALTAVQKVNEPLIVGVESGKTYTEKVTVRFNRGNALLDGEAFYDGETVYQNGTHLLEVIEGTCRKSVFFRISYTPASFEMTESGEGVSFSYTGGTATVDGVPYSEGTLITASGWHLFCLTDSLGETVTKQFYFDGALPAVDGVEDGGVYSHPVRIRIAGNGTAVLDGEPFAHTVFVTQDGTHELTVTNGTAFAVYRFTVQTDAAVYENGAARPCVIADEANGWYAVYNEMLADIRVYSAADGSLCRTVDTEPVQGYTFADGKLYIFGEWQLTVLDPAQMLSEADPVLHVISVRCDGTVYANGLLYCLADGVLHTLSEEDGTLTPVLETDASELYADGNVLWLYSEAENRFDRYADGVLQSFFPSVAASGKRKLFAGGMLFCGGSAVRISAENGTFSTVFSFDGYAVGLTEELLFTANGVYRLSDGVSVGGYDGAVSCVLPTERGTYVCGMAGSVRFYPHGETARYGYAPYTGALYTAPESGAAFSELFRLYGDVSPSALSASGDRFGAVFADERALVLYTEGVLTAQVSLPFSPDGLLLDGGRTCAWNAQNGLLWSDGVLFETGVAIGHVFVAMDTLYILGGGTLYRMEDGMLLDTGIAADGAAGGGTWLAWTEQGVLSVMHGETVLTWRVGAGKLFTDGTYLFCGKKCYRADSLQAAAQFSEEIFAVYDGTVLTGSGLYRIEDQKQIASFDAEGCELAALGGSAGAVFFGGRTLTVSRFDRPVYEEPLLAGLPADGLADGQAVIFFDRGNAFLDGVPFASGDTVSQAGEHVLTLVLPCAAVREYPFVVVPHLEEITFSNVLYRLAAGERDVLHVRYHPEGTSSIPVVYSVYGDCIRLEADGSFVALHEGEAIVNARTEDGRFVAACRILVTASLLRFDETCGYRVDREKGVLTGVPAGTGRKELLSHVISEGNVTVSHAKMKTGTVLTLLSSEGEILDRLTVAVEGDTDGDGYVTLSDLLLLEQALRDGTSFEGAAAVAADLNSSGGVTNRDASLLRDRLLYRSGGEMPLPPQDGQGTAVLLYPSSVCVGDTLEVTVYLQNAAGAEGMSARLFFDGTVLEYLGSKTNGMAVQTHAGDGFVSFLVSDKPSAQSGCAAVTLRFAVCSASASSLLTLCDGVLVGEDGVHGIAETVQSVSAAERVYGELHLDIEGMQVPFDRDIREYDVYVPIETLALQYRVQYPEGCSVTVRNTVFGAGDTLNATFTFRLADSRSVTYTVHAYRTNVIPTPADTTLSSLTFAETDFLFDPNVTAYTLYVPYGISALTPEWVAADGHVTVACSDTSLEAGTYTVITLTVTAKGGGQTVYTLTVYRENAAAEESSEEENSAESSLPAETGAVSEPDPSRKNSLIWLLPVILLLAGSGVIIGMYRNEKNRSERI